jgi:cytochrome c-type biogenesis protein CcmH/NrfG
LVQATRLQPKNFQTWLSLGQFDLQQHRPRRAYGSLLRALRLDRTDPETIALVAQARSELGIGRPGG